MTIGEDLLRQNVVKLRTLQIEIDHLILRTPTGARRNVLTMAREFLNIAALDTESDIAQCILHIQRNQEI